MTMSACEAARLLGIHPQTLRRWIRRRLLKCRKRGNRWQLTAADVQTARQLAEARLEHWLFSGNAGQARRLYRAGALRTVADLPRKK